MNRDGHDIIALLFLSCIVPLGVLSYIGGELEQFVFMISFLVFSTKISPDIDIKIPFIGHRGITHRHDGILVVSAIIAAIFLFGFPYLKINISENLMWPVIFGMVISWLLHSATDWIYDNLKQHEILPWIPFGALVLIEIWWLKK